MPMPPRPAPGVPRAVPGSVLALRNWPVACRLIVLVAIPVMLSLTLAGFRLADTMRSGAAYGQVGQVAVLGQQVAGLAQAMEDERADTGVFIADGRPAAGLAALHRQYVITDRRATTVRRLALRLGRQLGPDAVERGHDPRRHRQAAWSAQHRGAEPGSRADRHQ